MVLEVRGAVLRGVQARDGMSRPASALRVSPCSLIVVRVLFLLQLFVELSAFWKSLIMRSSAMAAREESQPLSRDDWAVDGGHRITGADGEQCLRHREDDEGGRPVQVSKPGSWP